MSSSCRSVSLGGGDGCQVTAQELFSLTFEFHEHDAVAELGMPSDDDSANDNGITVEPKGGLDADRKWELQEHLDVAAAATEVGGYEAHGNVAALLSEFDLDLEGVARMKAPVGFGCGGGSGLGVGRIHGSAPGTRCLQGSWSDHRR